MSTGTDNKLDDEAAGAMLMTCPTGAAAEGRRLCRSLFVGRNPQDVPGYAGGAAGLLPGGIVFSFRDFSSYGAEGNSDT